MDQLHRWCSQLLAAASVFSALGVCDWAVAQSSASYGDVNAVAVSPDGAMVAVASDHLTVRHAASLKVHWQPDADVGEARSVAFSRDGSLLVSGHRNGALRIWHCQDWGEARVIQAHKASVNGVAFSADGELLASASSDRTVGIWRVVTGERIAACEGHSCTVNSVAFSPAGGTLASAASDMTVRLWDGTSGAEEARFEAHSSSVWSVSWSPDGHLLATGSWDRTVRVWDVRSRTCVRVLRGHGSHVRGVAFSPDGLHVASASWDRSLRVWNVASGTEVGAFRGHLQPIRAVAFFPDGHQMVSGAAYEADSLRLWQDGIPYEPEGRVGELTAPVADPDADTLQALAPVELVPGKKAWRDGTHPDQTHAAIEAALVEAAGGKGPSRVVVLPPGRYLFTGPLSISGASLRGAGAVLIARNVTEKYFFGLTLGDGARLEDLTILGEGNKCVPVRFANPARDVGLRDVHIREGTILVDGQAHIENVVFDTCLFEDGGYGLLLDRPSSGRNVRITNCTFRNNRSDAIELNFPHQEKGCVVEDIVIANCTFEGTGRDPDNGHAGFSVGMAGARGVQIVGNSFRRAAVQAIHIEDHAEQITITGNNFIHCGVDHTKGNWTGGVHVLSGSRYIAISGNTFTNCRFAVSGLQAHKLQWCTITGNTVRNSTIGIRIMQFPRGVIQGNLFENCQTAINIWRTPLWNVSGNVITTKRPGGVGLRCTQFRDIVVTGNTIHATTPIDHREAHGDHGTSLVENNVLVPSASDP